MSLEHSPARQKRKGGRARALDALFEPSYAPDDFCRVENISRSKLYEYWRQGKGPRFYLNGNTRRITHTARLEWQAERIAEVDSGDTTTRFSENEKSD
jgi:hypothetical protein